MTPTLFRPAGGLTNDTVLATAKRLGLAEIHWDVVPFDWINDSNTAATTDMLKTQIAPGSVVLFHDTYSALWMSFTSSFRCSRPTATTW